MNSMKGISGRFREERPALKNSVRDGFLKCVFSLRAEHKAHFSLCIMYLRIDRAAGFYNRTGNVRVSRPVPQMTIENQYVKI